jgi:hypothetical protein
MTTAGFTAVFVPQEGTYTIHQNITCHYHVYAPTTVQVRSRCMTESSSEASLGSSPPGSIPRGSPKPDVISLRDLGLETGVKPKPGGKRHAILEWLLIKLTALLKSVAS